MAGSLLSAVITILVFAAHLVFSFHDNKIFDCYEKLCNRHSYKCSRRLRSCSNCQDFTHGRYCHLCKEGFYGNATNPKDSCKRCPCSPLKSNGSCTHNEISNTVKCHACKVGYAGDHCENCTSGYYKDLKDELCRPCYCSGHGNESLKPQCDPIGGRCYVCLHRRAGNNCEHCLDGHYLKKVNGTEVCAPCNCNGNEHPLANPVCDMKSGMCLRCVKNATGINCETCAHGYEGDAVVAKNCSLIKPKLPGNYKRPTKYLIVVLTTVLSIIIFLLLATSMFIVIRRRKTRDPLGFVTVSMKSTDEDDYNIAWIDPVTGNPIHHNDIDVGMPLANGALAESVGEDYCDEDDLGDSHERESRDTDRML